MPTPLVESMVKLCWNLLAQQEETIIWQNTRDAQCYSSKHGAFPICNGEDVQSYYKPLADCISGTGSKRWIPIQNRSSSSLSSKELATHGISPEGFFEDLDTWKPALRNYWSLLSPLIFSDHPKRPGDEDPMPPYNMVRNVMDMNAHYGGLKTAFLEARKSAWVMNVVPVGQHNTLPIILDQARKSAGVLHNWCEPFPMSAYPRTHDMLHAASERCSILDLLFEMDRILRPEGWVIISDKFSQIEMARTHVAQLRWEARAVSSAY